MNKLKIVLLMALTLGLIWPQMSMAQKGKPKKGSKTKTTKTKSKTTKTAKATTPPEPDFVRVPMVWDSAGYCPLSMRAVHKSDIMYKMQITRRLDLRQKCNQPWFAKQNEFTRFLIDGVKNGKLKPYMADDDSLNKVMNKKKFLEKIMDPSSQTDPNAPQQLDPITGKPIVIAGAGPVELLPTQLYALEISEDLIFDKQRSRMYYDIQYIKLIIPSEFNIKGTETSVAYFKYKDVAKYMNSVPTAKWYNVSNRAEDKRYSDAFDLRLFCSTIVKMSNPLGRQVQDEPSNSGSEKRTLIAAQKYEHDLVNKETELWDY